MTVIVSGYMEGNKVNQSELWNEQNNCVTYFTNIRRIGLELKKKVFSFIKTKTLPKINVKKQTINTTFRYIFQKPNFPSISLPKILLKGIYSSQYLIPFISNYLESWWTDSKIWITYRKSAKKNCMSAACSA